MLTKLRQLLYISFIKLIINFGLDEKNCNVLELIKSDLYRYSRTENLDDLYKFILSNPGLEFALYLRLGSLSPKSRIRKRLHAFAYYFHKRLVYKYGFQIPIGINIGKGFQILHFGAIIFNPLSKIGENCTVFPGCVIGQDKKGLAPTIGNKVWIGSNSIVVGGISIGNNVLIAPGSFVNFDIPDNCLVIGNPAKSITKNPSVVDGYLNNLV